MTIKQLVCMGCPMGCSMEVTLNGKYVVEVKGNSCPRGKAYAQAECTNPTRVITTTAATENGQLASQRKIQQTVVQRKIVYPF